MRDAGEMTGKDRQIQRKKAKEWHGLANINTSNSFSLSWDKASQLIAGTAHFETRNSAAWDPLKTAAQVCREVWLNPH